jgi:hypothetical protein
MDTKAPHSQDTWVDPDDASDFSDEDFKRGVWRIGNRVLTLDEVQQEGKKIFERKKVDVEK